MFDERAMLFLYALTSAHPGTGQALGAVDLPVQREAHTALPVIQASGIKGAWRDHAGAVLGRDDPLLEVAFGPPTDRAHEHAGALAFTDARLLAFPARSALGLIAWVTSPFAWGRLTRDARLLGLAPPPAPAGLDGAAAASGAACVRDETIVLESYALRAGISDAARACADWLVEQGCVDAAVEELFAERLVFVQDDVLRDLTIHGAEVVARIALDPDTRTTSGPRGNLWYEELIPAETLFYLLALASEAISAGGASSASEVLEVVLQDDGEWIQLGGEATVGRGLFRVRAVRGEAR